MLVGRKGEMVEDEESDDGSNDALEDVEGEQGKVTSSPT